MAPAPVSSGESGVSSMADNSAASSLSSSSSDGDEDMTTSLLLLSDGDPVISLFTIDRFNIILGKRKAGLDTSLKWSCPVVQDHYAVLCRHPVVQDTSAEVQAPLDASGRGHSRQTYLGSHLMVVQRWADAAVSSVRIWSCYPCGYSLQCGYVRHCGKSTLLRWSNKPHQIPFRRCKYCIQIC